MDESKESREAEECVFNISSNFDANKLAMLPQPLTPSTTGTLPDLDGLFNCLMSDQNSSLLSQEMHECARFSVKENAVYA